MLNIGVVTFDYKKNQKESKRVGQRMITIGKQQQQYTRPLHMERLDASKYINKDNHVSDVWLDKMRAFDGLIFVIPKDSRDIDNQLEASIKEASAELQYKTFLLVEYGHEEDRVIGVDVKDLARSVEMQVIYKTVEIPMEGASFFPGYKTVEDMEKATTEEIKKLFYFTMGSKYTRSLLTRLTVD